MLNGSNGSGSLRRRRGTKARGRRGGASPTAALWAMVCILALALVGSLTLLWGIFSTLTAEEKKETVDRMKHKVQALRGGDRQHQVVAPPDEANNINNAISSAAAAAVKADHSYNHAPPAANRFKADGIAVGVAGNEKMVPVSSGGGGSGGDKWDGVVKPYPYPLDKLATDQEVSSYQPQGGYRYDEYISGHSPYQITDDVRLKSDALARSRRTYVKQAMEFAWKGYSKYAYGYDEIKPQSAVGDNGWGGQAITLVDALDTLWIMGMKDEFWQARDWVRDNLTHAHTGLTSLFETTIRDLGGLLSAYDLSGDEAFLTKAVELGNRLLHGFDNAPSGLPYGQVNLRDGTAKNVAWTAGNSILSEVGTIQVENRYLSKVTNDPIYAEKTEPIFRILHDLKPEDWLYPYFIKSNGAQPKFSNQKLTFGAMSDSFYEYMLKIWIQGGKTESFYREMYDESIEGMHNVLLQTSSPSGLTYIADKNSNKMDHKMDHLVCFMGGLLALGAYTDPLGMDSPRAQRDMKTAKALTYTCYQMYARMATGISPEFVQFVPGRDFQVGRNAAHYLLRPEAIESFYILNQITGDPIYREWGWEVFLSIEKYCKTSVAYGSLPNVQDVDGRPKDKMESFFLAETLKYLYLLQDPDSEIDVLHTHVLNTEAHPLRIFPKLDQAKQS